MYSLIIITYCINISTIAEINHFSNYNTKVYSLFTVFSQLLSSMLRKLKVYQQY